MNEPAVAVRGRDNDPLALLKSNEASRKLLKAVADKWVILILLTLDQEPKRYSEILNSVEGISQKVLSQRLTMLTDSGMMTRTSYPETPPRVVYTLTDLGRSAVPAAETMALWVHDNVATVIAARS